jgi:predicted nucleic acid-binding protein
LNRVITCLVPDLAVAHEEKLRQLRRQYSLKVIRMSRKEVAAVREVRGLYPRLSFVDAVVLVAAKFSGILLLASDGDLRRAAECEKVRVHGSLWVLDEALRAGVLSCKQSKEALRRMVEQGRRLPADEIRKRLSRRC